MVSAADQAENLRVVGFAGLNFEPGSAAPSNEDSGLGLFGRSLFFLPPKLSGSGEKGRLDRHLYRQARFLRQAFDGLAKLWIVLQIKGVNKLLRSRVSRDVRTIVDLSTAISKPLKTDGQCLRQLRCHLSTRFAATLFVPRNLGRSNTADFSQVGLRPAMAGARLD